MIMPKKKSIAMPDREWLIQKENVEFLSQKVVTVSTACNILKAVISVSTSACLKDQLFLFLLFSQRIIVFTATK